MFVIYPPALHFSSQFARIYSKQFIPNRKECPMTFAHAIQMQIADMLAHDITPVEGIVLVCGLSFSFVLFMLGISILRSGPEWERNREAIRMYNKGNTFLTSMPYDYRDRIEPGLGVDTKRNEWIIRASPSLYALKKIFR
jgi:hypothetical protein